MHIVEQYGRLAVHSARSGQPLPGTYVKVYARVGDGDVRFYKDGYTDIRGRFDYTSLSTDELDRIERFAVLCLSPEHGSVIKEVGAPKR